MVKCKNCDISFSKKGTEIRKSPNHFCSKSCSVTYNNKNKKYGYTRSKFEIWLEEQLKSLYSFKIEFNSKKIIGSELDIYIPSLLLAFEINGPTHYKPIYGKEKLNKTQANDRLKRKKCRDLGIKFRSINISEFKYFTPKKAKRYLNQIIKIIIT